jgi:enoyl-CoA hydratase
VCDLIVASDDAEFSDTAVSFGMNGGEYFVHQFEMGTRIAKEMLFTGEPISARRAYEIGMVNRVVPRDELTAATDALARRIAGQPTMGIKLAKQSIHDSLDAQGQWTAVSAAFGRHQLGHSHNMQVHGRLVDPAGLVRAPRKE